MLVFLNGIADIEWLARMDVLEVLGHIEGDAIYNTPGGIIDQFELDVLKIATNEATRSEILHATGAECWDTVARAEWSEEAQGRHKLRGNFREGKECIDIDLGRELLG